MFRYVHATKKEKFWNRHDNVVIGVSLQNPNLTGDRFEKVIEWVNRQANFKRCYVDFADTLNRHNYMLFDGLDEDAAHRKAIENGGAWLEANASTLGKLNIPYQIMRWDRWLRHPRFPFVLHCMEQAYDTYEPFQKAVHDAIHVFFERRGLDQRCVQSKEYRHAVDFILEEISVDTIIYESMKAAYIYPSKETDAYKMVRERKVPGVPHGLENSYYVFLIAEQSEAETPKFKQRTAQNINERYLFVGQRAA